MEDPPRALVIMRKPTGALRIEARFESEIPKGAIVIIRESDLPFVTSGPANHNEDEGD